MEKCNKPSSFKQDHTCFGHFASTYDKYSPSSQCTFSLLCLFASGPAHIRLYAYTRNLMSYLCSTFMMYVTSLQVHQLTTLRSSKRPPHTSKRSLNDFG